MFLNKFKKMVNWFFRIFLERQYHRLKIIRADKFGWLREVGTSKWFLFDIILKALAYTYT